MAKTIGTAGSSVVEILHSRCGKPVARVVDGELQVECTRRGCREWTSLPGWVELSKLQQVFELIKSGVLGLDQILDLADPLASYRQIDGLIVMGPEEIERAFQSKDEENPNPLDLPTGWCQSLAPLVPWSVDEVKRVKDYCQTKEWQCQPVLRLMLPTITYQNDPHPTSLAEMYGWWGVGHDGFRPGRIRQDVFWSNWYLQNPSRGLVWVDGPAVNQAHWQLSYLPHPFWTTSKSWQDQQKEAEKYPDIRFASAPEEIWMMNILAANNIKCRQSTWTRTSTFFDGYPLEVNLRPRGVTLSRSWFPVPVYSSVGAAVAGVWNLAA